MDGAWDELGEGVFRRRYRSLDLNIGVVIGGDGVLVVDTRASHVQAREMLDHLQAVTSLPVRWVVNTHWHWDHTFGNGVLAAAEIHGHVRCRDRLLALGAEAKAEASSWLDDDERGQIDEVEITPPTRVFTDAAAIDVGGRLVAMEHPGLGHTDNDILVTVEGAGVVFAGDLVEEGAAPYFGDGYPLAWPQTLARLEPPPGTVVVPGHGDVMTPADVSTQRQELAEVARRCEEGMAAGAFDAEGGPYPADTMRTAWERAMLEAQGSR